MKFDVLCFGSATCDIYLSSSEFLFKKEEDKVFLCQEYGSKIKADDCVITTGGGATNAAVCFERMGIQAGIIACTGKDYWGRVVRAKLAEEGVSLIHMQKTDKKGTSTSVALVGKDGGRTVIVYRAASNLLSEKEVDWERLNSDWIYASSLGGDFGLLEKITMLSRKKEIKIAFNPGGAEIKARKELKSFLPFVDTLVLNKDEILEFLGKEKYEKNDLLNLGCKKVLITKGKDGSSLYLSTGEEINCPAQKIKAVETTGAGDSFGSSFICGLIKGLSFEDSLKLASYNAKSVVSKVGPKEGLLFWPEAKKAIK